MMTIIGTMPTEEEWKKTKIKHLSSIHCFNALLLLFGKNRIQPYTYALLVELPLQDMVVSQSLLEDGHKRTQQH